MAFEVARLQILSGPMECAKGGLAESTSDALGNKSSSTLHARAGSLVGYIKIFPDRKFSAFRLEEHRAMICGIHGGFYTKFSRSFMLSISFATHILGLLGGSAVCYSKCVDGSVKVHFEKRSEVGQVPALAVEQVKTWECTVTNVKKNDYDRIMAGYFLMLLCGRLRFSDGQRITGMRLEIAHVDSKPVGFLELAAERTKASISR